MSEPPKKARKTAEGRTVLRWAIESTEKPLTIHLLASGFVLHRCELIAADDSAMVVKHQSGTLLIPLSAISHIDLGLGESEIEALRQSVQPRKVEAY